MSGNDDAHLKISESDNLYNLAFETNSCLALITWVNNAMVGNSPDQLYKTLLLGDVSDTHRDRLKRLEQAFHVRTRGRVNSC